MAPLIFRLVSGCLIKLSHPSPQLAEQFDYGAETMIYRQVEIVRADGHGHVVMKADGSQGFIATSDIGLGLSPDRHFVSFMKVTRGSSSTSEDVHFIGGAHCAPEDFVLAANGKAFDPTRFEGWYPDRPHAVRVSLNAREYQPAVPKSEYTVPR